MMSTNKSSMVMAILAMVLCLSSTVAADLYNPGKPLNCTTFASNCQALTDATYGNGKNATYTGDSVQCNVTNLSGAQPLCGVNVICLATFLVNGTTPVPIPAPAPLPSSGTNGTTGTTSAAGTGTATSSIPVPTSNPYAGLTVGSVDLTSKLLAMYDTSKCGSSAAVAQAATSMSAMILVASVVAFMSTAL